MSVEELCAAAVAAGDNCRVAFDTGPVDQIGGALMAIALVGITLAISGAVVLSYWLGSRR